jgi:hypothetical protein
VVMRHEGGYLRAAACIAAEQAAASPLVCMCATMARDPQAPGYQMCPRCTIAHDAIVDEWTRIGSLEDAVMRKIAAVGGPVVRDVGGPINVAASVAATIARLGEQAAALVPSWQPIETAPRDGTRIVAWVDGQNWRRCEVILWWRSSSSADARWHRDAERTLAVSGTPTRWMPLPEAPGVPASAQSGHLDGGARALDASEALREARVQGMREARRIIAECEGDHLDAWTAVDAAIEAVRKGER